jgi:hypothetical protein
MFSLCQFKLKKSVLTPEKLYFYMLRIIGGRSQSQILGLQEVKIKEDMTKALKAMLFID